MMDSAGVPPRLQWMKPTNSTPPAMSPAEQERARQSYDKAMNFLREEKTAPPFQWMKPTNTTPPPMSPAEQERAKKSHDRVMAFLRSPIPDSKPTSDPQTFSSGSPAGVGLSSQFKASGKVHMCHKCGGYK